MSKKVGCALAHVFTDGRYAIRPLDGELRNREIGSIRAYQRDIGTVQRRDEREMPAGSHLLGEQRGNGVRNRVMHMQQIEPLALGHFRHARGESQRVRRIVEQRVVRNFDFVIVDAGRIGVEPDRIGIADEVNFVPALRQFETQLGRDDSTTAIGGVAGDADAHAPSMG